jgi:uncharacterized coiled-coil protein SlyX
MASANVTLAEASALVSKGRTTLYRLVESGKLSVTKAADGIQRVEVAELCRVFGNDAVKMPEQNQEPANGRIELLEEQIAFLKDTIAGFRNDLSEARIERQSLISTIEGFTRLLPVKADSIQPEPKQGKKKGGKKRKSGKKRK